MNTKQFNFSDGSSLPYQKVLIKTLYTYVVRDDKNRVFIVNKNRLVYDKGREVRE